MSSTDINVTVYPPGTSISVGRGTPFRDAVDAAGVQMAFPCGMKGRCGKCRVFFEAGAPDATPAETSRLTEMELGQGYRLGCQTVLSSDAVVYLPTRSGLEHGKVLTAGVTRDVPLFPGITKRHVTVPKPSVTDLRSDLARLFDAFGCDGSCAEPSLRLIRRLGQDLRKADFDVTGVFSCGKLIALEPGDTTGECLGVAFDIGTTTLAGYLIDLKSGRQVAVASAMNPQARIGEDVISRINYTMRENRGLRCLQREVVSEINGMIDTMLRTASASRSRLYEVVVVGNTCMGHLFLGIDPQHLATSPYVPTVSRSLSIEQRGSGLRINRFGWVHVLPNIAGFVGADTVGVILATGLYRADRPVLAVDIGTNGEIVLGWKDRILACSTAAGPAFEGVHITHGMRAASGAIDAVWLDDGGVQFSTVNEAKARGICGSGLLDAIVCLCQAGIVESSGRIVDANEVPAPYHKLGERVSSGEHGNEFVLAPAEESADRAPIVITQRDVRELQLAKGAIAAGIQTLIGAMGITQDELESVVLAGAFGNYLCKESAVAAGLIPDVPLSKIRSAGNAAGEGAKLALVSLDMREEADRIARSVEYIELTTDPGFQDRFAEALMFGCAADA